MNSEIEKERSKKVWGASPAGSAYAKTLAPDTREFFEAVRGKRRNYELSFLNSDIPFSEWRGKKILEIGCGAGFDAYEIASRGGLYTGIDLTPENIGRCQAHLRMYGLTGDVREGDAEQLSFADNTFDVVYSNGVLHHTPRIEQCLREAKRVLRPGGELWVILYHRNSVFYLLTLGFFEQVLLLGFLRRSMKDRLSRIEYTTANERPLVNVYSRSQVAAMMERSGFRASRVMVRRLIREDFPGIRPLQYVLKFVPQRFLDAFGHWFGWYVIAAGTRS